MNKSKMAVRNKRQSRQLKFNLSMGHNVKSGLRIFSLLMVVSSIGFLVVKANQSWRQIWPVETIVLEGNVSYLKQADLVSFMQQQPELGMLAIDLQQLQDKAKAIDWIKSVEIRKVWPQQLVFVVEEHQPVAWFGEKLLTQQGTILKTSSAIASLSNLPRIMVSDSNGLQTENYPEVWRRFKKMARQFELIGLSLNELEIDEVNNWQLVFNQQLKMNLGRKNRFERVNRLVQVYTAIENKQLIKKIDLRYHNGLAVEWSDKQALQKKG